MSIPNPCTIASALNAKDKRYLGITLFRADEPPKNIVILPFDSPAEKWTAELRTGSKDISYRLAVGDLSTLEETSSKVVSTGIVVKYVVGSQSLPPSEWAINYRKEYDAYTIEHPSDGTAWFVPDQETGTKVQLAAFNATIPIPRNYLFKIEATK